MLFRSYPPPAPTVQCDTSLFLAGGNFTLAELGVCEPSAGAPPHPASPYCPDLALLHRGFALGAASDADSDPEGPLSPERAIQLWAGPGGGAKSRRSSGVSSRENSALTLTDSDNDHKSDDESGRRGEERGSVERRGEGECGEERRSVEIGRASCRERVSSPV